MKNAAVNTAALILCSVFGFTGQVHTQALEHLFIHRGKNHGRVNVAAPQLAQLLHGQLCGGIGGCADGQGDQHLISMEPRISVAQMFGL